MKTLIAFLFSLCLLAHGDAQTCNGTWGMPIVDQTFGHGIYGTQFYGPLSAYAPGVTTTTTFVYGGPADNYSCLTDNASYGQPSWCNVTDHTGDPYGLMFEINAPSSGGTVFVEYTMHDLCPNTTLQLSIWVLNIDGTFTGQQYPNMTMKLVDAATSTVLDTTNTGDVPFDNAWHQYTMIFNNAGSTTVTLQVINNSVGSGYGNDLALDDITVSPCVPITHITPKLDTIINCQAAFIPFTANITGNVYNPAEYQWQYSADMGATWANALPASSSPTYYFTASAAGTYWVRFLTGPVGFSGNSSCSAISDTSIITVTATALPSPPVTSPVIYCQYATATALTAVTTAGANLDWYATDTSTAALPGTPLPNTSMPGTTYYFVTQQSSTCVSPPDSIEIIVNSLPSLTAASDAPICFGGTLQLSATSTTPGVSYSWQGPDGFSATGSNQSVPNVTAAGLYTVIGTENGCSDTASDTVALYPLPNAAISAAINGTLCTGDSLLLTINNYDTANKYKWAPSDLFQNPDGYSAEEWVKVGLSQQIYLTTTTPPGCVGTDSLLVTAQPCCIVNFPSAFTPNDDGKNDVFRPITIGNHVSYHLVIVNRWGQTVFETYKERQEWDGTLNGIPQDMGVYEFFATYECNGRQATQKGDVTLIR